MITYHLSLPPPHTNPHPIHHLLYVKILKDTFQKRKHVWQKGSQKQKPHYSNIDDKSDVKNHLTVFSPTSLSHKCSLALLLEKESFHPQNYIIHYPSPQKNPPPVNTTSHSGKKWFYKPNQGGQSKNVSISDNLQQLLQKAVSQNIPAVVQAEIAHPLLYEGRKIEIRTYVIKTYRHGVMNTILYKRGYTIVAPLTYQDQDSRKGVHCTNGALYTSQESQLTCHFALEEWDERMSTGGCATSPSSSVWKESLRWENIWKSIQDIVKRVETCLSSKGTSSNKNLPPQYEILAYDFIVDENGKVWLVEINRYPGINLPHCVPSERDVKKKLYQQLVPFILEPFLLEKSIPWQHFPQYENIVENVS